MLSRVDQTGQRIWSPCNLDWHFYVSDQNYFKRLLQDSKWERCFVKKYKTGEDCHGLWNMLSSFKTISGHFHAQLSLEMHEFHKQHYDLSSNRPHNFWLHGLRCWRDKWQFYDEVMNIAKVITIKFKNWEMKITPGLNRDEWKVINLGFKFA